MSVLTPEKRPAAENDVGYVITEEQVQDLTPVDASKHPYRILKRLVDVMVSALMLVVLIVPLAIIALVIYIDDPGSVIFTQNRVGLGRKEFRLYKFRTMKLETPKYVATMDMKDPYKYITKVGKVLRKLSLDELPQLVNVIKGDMSLIGPRPLIPSEKPIHDMRERFGVYTVRPGVTGLAQVNGRDAVFPADKVRFDVKYVTNFGLATDLKILFYTIPKVFAGSDVVEGKSHKK